MSAVVIGGGIAGLAAAHRIARSGRDVVLVEAADRLGGMVAPLEIAGITIDQGAEAFSRRLGIADELCATLGLATAAPAGTPHIRWAADQIWPAADGVLGIPSRPEDPALAAALDPESLAIALAEPQLGDDIGADAVTVAELVTARLGPTTLDRLVAPITTSVYGMPPATMSLQQFAPGLRGPGSLYAKVAAMRGSKSSVAQPIGGLFRLVTALADDIAKHGGEIRLGQRATALKPGWLVETTAGEIAAESVVLACPAAPAVVFLQGLNINITAPPTSQALSVLIAIEAELLADQPVGSGVLLGQPIAGLQAKALTHYSAKWPWSRQGAEILRLSYSSQATPTVEQALADASILTGRTLTTALDFAVVRWPQVPRSLAPDQRAALRGSLPRGLTVAGAWVAGNGIEAAIASGFEAA